MFNGLISWIFNLIVDAVGSVVAVVMNIVLEVSLFHVTDKGGLLETFPALSMLYYGLRNVALGLAVLIFLYSLIKVLIAPLSEVHDNPVNLVVRFVASIILILAGNNLVVGVINMAYSGYVEIFGLKKTIVDSSNFVSLGKNLLSGMKDQLAVGAVLDATAIGPGPLILISLIVFIIMVWNIYKILKACVYHWMHLIVIVYTSPLPFASIVSASTKPVFDKWIGLLIGECFSFLMCVWGLLVTESIFDLSGTHANLFSKLIWGSAFARVVVGIDDWVRQLGLSSISIPHGPGALGEIADKGMRLLRQAQMGQRIWDGQSGLMPLDKAMEGTIKPAANKVAGLFGEAFNDGNGKQTGVRAQTPQNKFSAGRHNDYIAKTRGAIDEKTGRPLKPGSKEALEAVRRQAQNGTAAANAQMNRGLSASHSMLADATRAVSNGSMKMVPELNKRGEVTGFKFQGGTPEQKAKLASYLDGYRNMFDQDDVQAQRAMDMAAKGLANDPDLDAKQVLAQTKSGFAITDPAMKQALADRIAREDNMKPGDQKMFDQSKAYAVGKKAANGAFNDAAEKANYQKMMAEGKFGEDTVKDYEQAVNDNQQNLKVGREAAAKIAGSGDYESARQAAQEAVIEQSKAGLDSAQAQIDGQKDNIDRVNDAADKIADTLQLKDENGQADYAAARDIATGKAHVGDYVNGIDESADKLNNAKNALGDKYNMSGETIQAVQRGEITAEEAIAKAKAAGPGSYSEQQDAMARMQNSRDEAVSRAMSSERARSAMDSAGANVSEAALRDVALGNTSARDAAVAAWNDDVAMQQKVNEDVQATSSELMGRLMDPDGAALSSENAAAVLAGTMHLDSAGIGSNLSEEDKNDLQMAVSSYQDTVNGQIGAMQDRFGCSESDAVSALQGEMQMSEVANSADCQAKLQDHIGTVEQFAASPDVSDSLRYQRAIARKVDEYSNRYGLTQDQAQMMFESPDQTENVIQEAVSANLNSPDSVGAVSSGVAAIERQEQDLRDQIGRVGIIGSDDTERIVSREMSASEAFGDAAIAAQQEANDIENSGAGVAVRGLSSRISDSLGIDADASTNYVLDHGGAGLEEAVNAAAAERAANADLHYGYGNQFVDEYEGYKENLRDYGKRTFAMNDSEAEQFATPGTKVESVITSDESWRRIATNAQNNGDTRDHYLSDLYQAPEGISVLGVVESGHMKIEQVDSGSGAAHQYDVHVDDDGTATLNRLNSEGYYDGAGSVLGHTDVPTERYDDDRTKWAPHSSENETASWSDPLEDDAFDQELFNH